ncbi:hypothetical protein [Propionivibrio sp.]|nr:hypothetical protein [Propionivibrio sp.]
MTKTFATERTIRIMVGANLFQGGFTRFCPAGAIMLRLGIKRNDGEAYGR